MAEISQARAARLSLEPKHCRAICHEIGDRLRRDLTGDASPPPMRLRKLIDQIAELEGKSPPIIPVRSRTETDAKRTAKSYKKLLQSGRSLVTDDGAQSRHVSTLRREKGGQ